MRSVPAEVNREGPVVGLSQHHRGGPFRLPPPRHDRRSGGRFEIKDVEEPAGHGDSHCLGLTADVPQRGDRPGHQTAPHRGHQVGEHPTQRVGVPLFHSQPRTGTGGGDVSVAGPRGTGTGGTGRRSSESREFGGSESGPELPPRPGPGVGHGFRHRDGLALAGQEALLVIQTERVDRDRRPFLQQPDDAGQRTHAA